MVKKVKTLFKIFLIVLFGSYYIGNTFFTHTHIINKYSITHSHPYLPGGSHTHTEMEYVVVSMFNAMLVTDSEMEIFNPSLLLFLLMIIISPSCTILFIRTINCLTLRAPPLFGFVSF